MSEEMDTSILGEKIVGTLKTIFDPEIPVDIYELGLIYDVLVNFDDLNHTQLSCSGNLTEGS